MEEFIVGDRVKLISNSPDMTIESINPAIGSASCVWYNEGRCAFEDREFKLTSLKKAL